MAADSTPVVDAAARAAALLDDLGARFVLIGGLAVAARSDPRYTRDVDLAVSVPDNAAAEQLLFALSRERYTVETLIEQSRASRLATARLRHRATPEVFVDLLFASSGIEPELVASAERLLYRPGLLLPVAQTGHLLALKALSESDARLQDRIDLQSLGAVATDADWALAERSARLIRARGFHRGRALVKRLRAWRAATSSR